MLTAVNLRTRLQWIIKRAGLKPWPKLWQNLRSTRETELADQFPAHVAAAWIGNSVAVAVKHYLQVTDEHFEKAAQNAAKKVHETARNDSKLATSPEREFNTSSDTCEPLREDSASFVSSKEEMNGRYRTRTIPIFPEEYANSGSGGAKCGALAATSRSGDDDLAQLINAWPSLPTTIRRGIMAMVEEMRKE